MKKFKKIFAVISASLILIVSANAFADSEISVLLNGEKVEFDNAKPIIYEERTLIPIRSVFEKLDWEVSWDSNQKMAIISNATTIISITIEDNDMQVYDIAADMQETVALDVPAMIINDSTMIPLRAVCEALGTEVNWNGNTKTVYIDTEV